MIELNTHHNHVKSLAGLFQACDLVKDIAWTGSCNHAALITSLSSILKLDTTDIDDIFGGVINLKYGLQLVINQLTTNSKLDDYKPSAEITRYAINLMFLEKKLSKHANMLKTISDGVSEVNQKIKHFEVTHSNIIAKFADIYQTTISQIFPKILVQGEHIYLSNTENSNKIRALLLSGIRYAVLFRQCKGSKIKLLLNRKHYLNIAYELIDEKGC